jgi:hypothetical protein
MELKPTLLKNLISPDVIRLLDIEFSMMRDCMKTLGSEEGFNDPSTHNTFSWYSPICFESLSVYIKKDIENFLKRPIMPTYSYGRIYMNGSDLKKHKDRQSSEITVSCCLRKDSPWPLCFLYKDKVYEFDLEPGDVVIGSGSETFHWRDKYNGKEHVQAFVQYVFADGDRTHLKYDTRPCLASPYELTDISIKQEPQNYKG